MLFPSHWGRNRRAGRGPNSPRRCATRFGDSAMHKNWKRVVIWSYLMLWLAAFIFLLVRALSVPTTLWIFEIFPLVLWGVILPGGVFLGVRWAVNEFLPNDTDRSIQT